MTVTEKPLGQILKKKTKIVNDIQRKQIEAAQTQARQTWLKSEKVSWAKSLAQLKISLLAAAECGKSSLEVMDLSTKDPFPQYDPYHVVLDGEAKLAKKWLKSQGISVQIINKRIDDFDEDRFCLVAYW